MQISRATKVLTDKNGYIQIYSTISVGCMKMYVKQHDVTYWRGLPVLQYGARDTGPPVK